MSPAPTQRIVLVTGASRGMGLEWVRQLLREPKTTFVIGLVRSVQSVSPDLAALQGDRLVLVEGDLGKRETFAVSRAFSLISSLTFVTHLENLRLFFSLSKTKEWTTSTA